MAGLSLSDPVEERQALGGGDLVAVRVVELVDAEIRCVAVGAAQARAGLEAGVTVAVVVVHLEARVAAARTVLERVLRRDRRGALLVMWKGRGLVGVRFTTLRASVLKRKVCVCV